MRRVDRLRAELLAACAELDRALLPRPETAAMVRRWRRMVTPRPKPARKREMDAEVRADLAEARRRRRGIPSESERRQAEADRSIADWNAAHPIGTEVWVTLDDKSKLRTRTRSVAWRICDHASVMVEGISGGYLLERVRPTASAAMDALRRAGSTA